MLKNLDIPPTQLSLHYMHADFLELQTLIHPDRELGPDDIRRRYVTDASIDLDNKFDKIDGDRSTTNDRQTLRIMEWFSYIKARSHSYSTSYPFEISNNLIRVKSDLTDAHKLYLYLLMSSSLRHFSKSIQMRLGKSFELLCAEALKRYVGENADIRIFGSGGYSDYPGNKYNKLMALADDIHERIVAEETEFSPHDTGDEGLDIVGFIEFHDNNPGSLILFAQCACTEDWEEKQADISFDKWSQLISLSVRPINTICIPFCFRNSSGRWFRNRRIHRNLMIDRRRIVNLLVTTVSPLCSLPIDIVELIDDAISFVDEF